MLKTLGIAIILGTLVATVSACYKQGLLAKFPKYSNPASQNSTVQITHHNPASAKQQLPTCVQKKCNCRDFSNQRQAQAVLEAFPNDPHKLDRNKNGIACESLPK